MQPSFKELKKNARETLLGKYSLLIFAYLFVELIFTTLTSLFTPSTETLTPVQTGVYYVADFIISILIMVFSAGLYKMIMNMVRGEEVHPRLVFFAFRSSADRFIIAGTLLSILSLAPFAIPTLYDFLVVPDSDEIAVSYLVVYLLLTLLACVLTILITLRFSFVMQILLDDIYCGAIEAFKRSSQLMKGHCLRLFALDFSFLGWILLGLLTFGIGYLWIIPYYQTTITYFYFSLTGEMDERNQEEAYDDSYDDGYEDSYGNYNNFN